jgi:hypothetical protein
LKTSHYNIHNIGVRLTTDRPEVAAAVDRHLGAFPRELPQGAPVLELDVRGVADRRDIPIENLDDFRLLASGNGEDADVPGLDPRWKFEVRRNGDRNVIDVDGQCLLSIKDQGRRVDGYLTTAEVLHPDACARFVLFGLTELLKEEGFYKVHAAGLVKDGRGVLFAGFSGRGKTTSCLALVRAGYRCLSDDYTLVRDQGSRVEALPFPTKVDVTETTIDLFPELARVRERLPRGIAKKYCYLEEIYPDCWGEACEPLLLFFPRVVDWPRSRAEVLPRSRALEELLPHGLLVFGKAVALKQFQTLSRLVRGAHCYRLFLGEDIRDLPGLVDPLLERTRTAANA